MNDTQTPPPPAGPDDEFDSGRLRTVADMQRSRDDRIVAGVCAGAARYLNVDPVIIRVVLAVLTLAGFAGLILYLAAWVLLPAEGEEKSLAADWFNLDKNEPQVRVAGLVGALILAVLSIVGDSSWAWWGDSAWWLLPFGLVFYVVWVRPRRKRQAREKASGHVPSPVTTDHATATMPTQVIAPHEVAAPHRPRSFALLGLTVSLAAIALAATWIYDETRDDLHWTSYLAVALAVVGVGLLIGTFFGHGGPLIGIGILLVIALGIGSVFPSGRIGEQTPTPTVAADVKDDYTHGIGKFELDLTQVSDTDRLLGRTVTIDAGLGETRVILPAGLNVDLVAEVDAGEISVFGRDDDGTDVKMADSPDRPGEPALSIDVDHQLGRIEVIRR